VPQTVLYLKHKANLANSFDENKSFDKLRTFLLSTCILRRMENSFLSLLVSKKLSNVDTTRANGGKFLVSRVMTVAHDVLLLTLRPC